MIHNRLLLQSPHAYAHSYTKELLLFYIHFPIISQVKWESDNVRFAIPSLASTISNVFLFLHQFIHPLHSYHILYRSYIYSNCFLSFTLQFISMIYITNTCTSVVYIRWYQLDRTYLDNILQLDASRDTGYLL